jgi:hypothetical protein
MLICTVQEKSKSNNKRECDENGLILNILIDQLAERN